MYNSKNYEENVNIINKGQAGILPQWDILSQNQSNSYPVSIVLKTKVIFLCAEREFKVSESQGLVSESHFHFCCLRWALNKYQLLSVIISVIQRDLCRAGTAISQNFSSVMVGTSEKKSKKQISWRNGKYIQNHTEIKVLCLIGEIFKLRFPLSKPSNKKCTDCIRLDGPVE